MGWLVGCSMGRLVVWLVCETVGHFFMSVCQMMFDGLVSLLQDGPRTSLDVVEKRTSFVRTRIQTRGHQAVGIVAILITLVGPPKCLPTIGSTRSSEPINRRLGGPQSWSGCFEVQKNPFFPLGLEPCTIQPLDQKLY